MIEIILSRCVSFVSFYLELINASVELFIWRFDYTAAELIHILNVSTLVSMIHGFQLFYLHGFHLINKQTAYEVYNQNFYLFQIWLMLCFASLSIFFFILLIVHLNLLCQNLFHIIRESKAIVIIQSSSSCSKSFENSILSTIHSTFKNKHQNPNEFLHDLWFIVFIYKFVYWIWECVVDYKRKHTQS